jgi:hypothetical protein
MDYTYEKLNRKLDVLNQTQTHKTKTYATQHTFYKHTLNLMQTKFDQEEE